MPELLGILRVLGVDFQSTLVQQSLLESFPPSHAMQKSLFA